MLSSNGIVTTTTYHSQINGFPKDEHRHTETQSVESCRESDNSMIKILLFLFCQCRDWENMKLNELRAEISEMAGNGFRLGANHCRTPPALLISLQAASVVITKIPGVYNNFPHCTFSGEHVYCGE